MAARPASAQPKFVAFASVALAGALSWAAPFPSASAQVRECMDPSGTRVFTDRQCRDIGAVERRRTTASPGATLRLHQGGCARNLQDLLFEVTSAIDSRDPNRLAAVYHWTGMSGRTGYSILDRLDAITQRPLVDIIPVMPATPAGLDGSYYPQASVRQLPIGLRVEQTLANGSTPSTTTFGLQRHLGCWWLRG
ncbi:hypothetical protein [Lysobacter sp. A3-1-A15]|uniref:hypothetical protein n=1 Tax=Novilysobacter viscosus TaxID=3098602 RepID=UPI002ED7B8C0